MNKYLQSLSHPYIFAAGDCCEMANEKRMPKAGVYAVRSGPILIQNLMQQLLNDRVTCMVQYEPQDDFLKLLMCGDGTALGFRFGVPLVSLCYIALDSALQPLIPILALVRKVGLEIEESY